MKRTWPLVAGLLLLTAQHALQAQFTYTNIDGAITITGYSGPGGAVAIPSEINNLPVTSIGGYAFDNIDTLTSVTIPNSVTSLEYYAFQGCDNLTNATIGDSVTNIGTAPFALCASLMEINVNADNPAYASEDGVLFNQAETILVEYPGNAAASYLIPSSVTSIGEDAFFQCRNLESVTIPESVTNIGDEAFSVCANLESITIPDSVTSIGDGAFNACFSLANVTIGDSVTNIGGGAFFDCFDLASVTIPDSVTSIGGSAFWTCVSLMAINVNAGNPTYASVDGVLFNKTETTLVEYPAGNPAGSYTIPSSVTNIGGSAFYDCLDLTNVTIPDSVTTIGDNAFQQCNNLTKVTVGDGVTSIGNLAFQACFDLATVLFQGNAPPGADSTVFADDNTAKVYYYHGATGWSSTFDGRPTKMLPPPPPPPPPFTASGIQLSGSNVILSATNGLSGAACYVLMSANLALPLSQWTPVATNVLDSSGTATITLTNATAAGTMQSFYILQQ